MFTQMTTRTKYIIARIIFSLLYAVLLFRVVDDAVTLIIVMASFLVVLQYLDKKIGYTWHSWHWPWRKKA